MSIKSSQRGFTIIESLVALAILSLALTPMLVVVTMSSRIATSVKNNLVAALLAQEGIEVIRAIRDTNWLNGQLFYTGLNEDAETGTTKDGLVQYNTTGSLLPYNADAKLYLDNVSGIYSYDSSPSSSPTIFTRKMSVTKISDAELKIVSEVTWNEPPRLKIISVESHLFDWK